MPTSAALATLMMTSVPTTLRPIEQILELARWAPSGDNTQPWRFEVVDAGCVVLHGFDTRDHCVYDLGGGPSQMSIGALIETMSIAASVHGLRLDAMRRAGYPDETPTFDLRLRPDPSVVPDALVDMIPRRSVQRRPMATRTLTDAEKGVLEASVGAEFGVRWIEGTRARWQAARLMFRSAKLRLTMPEAYRVHRDVIQWNARFSADRVPDRALGVDRATLLLMRFVMQSWSRVSFFNRYLAGTWIPRLQMDLLPAVACGAHFVLTSRSAPVSIDDHVQAGRALQRFWLAATQLGLMLQPEMTPLIFTRYARAGIPFSNTAGMAQGAQDVAAGLDRLVGPEVARRGVFFGRLGAGPFPAARSTRRDLAQLLDRTAPDRAGTPH